MSKHSKNAVEGYLKNKQQSNLGSYNALANQYTDAVREPGYADAIGDAYSQAGSGPANGPAQRETNALLSGIGAGFSGSANEERRAKLSPIEEQTQSLLQMDAMLKQQMYEEESQGQQVKQFFKQATVPIAELSKASINGDTAAANQIGQGILRTYKNIFQDPSVGDFDHYHNGTVYFENLESGQIEGRNIVQLMYQSGIDPAEMFGQDAPMIEAGLSPGAKMNYENTMQAQKYQLQNMGLQNQKLRSGINYDNFRTQPQASAEAPVDDNAEITSIIQTARDRITQLGAGSKRDFSGRLLSNYAGDNSSDSAGQAEINTLGDILRGKLFNAWGYKNEAEFKHVPSISPNNSREANLAILKQLENLFSQSSASSDQGSVVMTNKATAGNKAESTETGNKTDKWFQ